MRDLIIGFAKWYMRRRKITQIMLALLIVVLPVLGYAYFQAKTTPVVQVPTLTENNDILSNYTPILCDQVIRRVDYNTGPFAHRETCYKASDNSYIYMTVTRYGLLVVYNNTSDGKYYLISLPYDMRMGNLSLSYLTIYLKDSGNLTEVSTTLYNILKEYNATTAFCKYFKPSRDGWEGRSVPVEVYQNICIRGGGQNNP